jgi:hypothetical protein
LSFALSRQPLVSCIPALALWLHIDPALSPAKAVRAFIVQEYNNAEEA